MQNAMEAGKDISNHPKSVEILRSAISILEQPLTSHDAEVNNLCRLFYIQVYEALKNKPDKFSG
jgi:hypothetical protein